MNALVRQQIAEHLTPVKEVFTLVLEDPPRVLVFDVGAMRRHLSDVGGVGCDLMAMALHDEALKAQRARAFFSRERFRSLLVANPRELWEPVLAILLDDGKTYIVDGYHRLAAWSDTFKMELGTMARFRLGEWERFVLKLPPELTEYLRDDTMNERKGTPS